MAENIFPSAGRNYVRHINRGASRSSLFTTKKIDLYASIYGSGGKAIMSRSGFAITDVTIKCSFVGWYQLLVSVILEKVTVNINHHHRQL